MAGDRASRARGLTACAQFAPVSRCPPAADLACMVGVAVGRLGAAGADIARLSAAAGASGGDDGAGEDGLAAARARAIAAARAAVASVAALQGTLGHPLGVWARGADPEVLTCGIGPSSSALLAGVRAASTLIADAEAVSAAYRAAACGGGVARAAENARRARKCGGRAPRLLPLLSVCGVSRAHRRSALEVARLAAAASVVRARNAAISRAGINTTT